MAEPSTLGLTDRAQPWVSLSRGTTLSDLLHPSIGTDLKAGQASSHVIIVVGAWHTPCVIYPIAPVRTLRFKGSRRGFPGRGVIHSQVCTTELACRVILTHHSLVHSFIYSLIQNPLKGKQKRTCQSSISKKKKKSLLQNIVY